MTATTALVLISHATTEAVRRARFAADEGLDGRGERDARAATYTAGGAVLIAPERRAQETAAALDLSGKSCDALRDLNHGGWATRRLTDLPADRLDAWLTNTATSPPDGESIDALLSRIGTWMRADAAGRAEVAAVTHPAVIRAVVVTALGAPSSAFWRIDVPPLTTCSLHHRGGRWTLRSLAARMT